MADMRTPLGSTSQIIAKTGIGLQGNPVLKNRIFRNGNPRFIKGGKNSPLALPFHFLILSVLWMFSFGYP